MDDSVIARRADDLVISVQQNNATQSVSVTDVNERALALLGFADKQSVVGSSLYSILDTRTQGIVSSYLEFTDDGTDLSEVISKIRGFALLDNKLQPVPVRPKIFRTASEKGLLNYEILIRDTSLSQKLDAFRQEKLSADYRYTMHEDFGVMDEQSTATEVGVVLNFLNHAGVNAVICMVAVDQNASEGPAIMWARRVSDAISENVRYTDIVGYLGDRKFVFMLLGCDSGSAYSAVSRVHRNILERLSHCTPPATVSVTYAQMRGVSDPVKLVGDLKNTLLATRQESGSSIRLVGK
ncbi:MAG: hypothetical protein ACTJLL_03935 [Anaplasma sp.]